MDPPDNSPVVDLVAFPPVKFNFFNVKECSVARSRTKCGLSIAKIVVILVTPPVPSMLKDPLNFTLVDKVQSFALEKFPSLSSQFHTETRPTETETETG
jgi:hypothetical protein